MNLENKNKQNSSQRAYEGRHSLPRHPHLLMSLFFGSVALMTIVLIYSALNKGSSFKIASRNYLKLHKVIDERGIKEYFSEKKNLKRHIAHALRENRTTIAYISAHNVAVYLFPELLSVDNFERDVALTEWIPFQRKIEAQPRTHGSRLHFEEMRANIWNYENPDRQSPNLSAYARQAIRIYDSLSSP